jgi:cytoskeletal protein CcmA (bactofilin family)
MMNNLYGREIKLKLKENAPSLSSTELNFLGNGTFVEGTIKTESSVRVDGIIKGKLVCKNTLTVGVNGQIEGEIEAKNAIIGGKINGKIKVAEKLVLESKSALMGEIKASKLIIDEGAIFEGTSKMGKKDEINLSAGTHKEVKETKEQKETGPELAKKTS